MVDVKVVPVFRMSHRDTHSKVSALNDRSVAVVKLKHVMIMADSGTQDGSRAMPKYVQLSTFTSWRFADIGYQKKQIDNTMFVTKVWCNVCKGTPQHVFNHPSLRGASKAAIQTYINGTDFVTKHNVSRHLRGKVSFFGIFFYFLVYNKLGFTKI